MKVVALISGGKDSCYAMMKCIEYGHQVFLTVFPEILTKKKEEEVLLLYVTQKILGIIVL